MAGTVSGVRAVKAMREALAKAGAPPAGWHHGGQVTGWIPRNHRNSLTSAIRSDEGGRVSWFVGIDAENLVEFREYEFTVDFDEDGDPSYETGLEPQDPEVLAPMFREAFATLGLDVLSFRSDGNGGNGHEIRYVVETETPDWLEGIDLRNADPNPGVEPILRSASIRPMPMGMTHELPVYDLGMGIVALPRESVDELARIMASERRRDGQPNGEVSLDGGVLSVVRKGHDPFPAMGRMAGRPVPGSLGTRAERQGIVNHWGDRLDVWRIPRDWVEILPSFRSKIPVLIADEMVARPDFDTLDAQWGDDVPWRGPDPVPAPAAPAPRP